MASVGLSALGRTNLHFVDPGVKINGQYYRDTPDEGLAARYQAVTAGLLHVSAGRRTSAQGT